MSVFLPKSFGNFWVLIPPQSFRLEHPLLFCTIMNAIGTQPADKSTPNPIIFHLIKPLLAPVSNAASVKKTLNKLCKSKRRQEFKAVCEEVETAKCLCSDPCDCVDEPTQPDKNNDD